MKFHKSDFIKMGGTAIITALIIYFIFRSPKIPFSNTSEWISWDMANTYINDYVGKENPHPLKKLDLNGDFETLEGFKVDATQLNCIINKNQSGETPDQVAIYFGMEGLITNPKDPTDIQPNMHIIAIGVKGGKLLIPAPGQYNQALKCSILDKADPCPPCDK